jgi:ABC-type amino acid transport substrate-binding protein
MVYDKVGQYLCATDDSLKPRYIVDTEKERNTFANIVLSGNLSNNFAFLMMEDNEALRDEFSSAIKDMKDDGTMDKLVKEQIDTLINGGEAKAISMPEIEGADTIKVAVTGSLPPMDYVAADGTPAGFNTAVLAEISQRIGKNIELVVVDSIGRATALSSGTVDAVFWTRTNEAASAFAEMSEEERAAEAEKHESEMTDEEIEAHREVGNILSDFDHYNTADMPEGTICTVPYYSDVIVTVIKK